MSTFPWNLNKESYRMQILSGIRNIADPNDVTIKSVTVRFDDIVVFDIEAGSCRRLVIDTKRPDIIYNKNSVICRAEDVYIYNENNFGHVKITCLEMDGGNDDIILQELKSIHSKLDTLLEQKAIS